MKTLRQFLEEQKNNHPQGTYISAHCDQETKDAVEQLAKQLNLSNPAPPEQYHSTIIYSRKGVPETENYTFPGSITGTFKEWKIFENRIQGTKCLVAVVDSDQLHHWHEKIMSETDATYDFDEYHPHITLTYEYEHKDVPSITPDFPFNYDKVVVKPLDPTFVPSKNKAES